VPPEIHLEAPLAPRAPVTTEPLTPPAVVMTAEPAAARHEPGARAPSDEPLVPPVRVIDGPLEDIDIDEE
jgi:hypothetical protein